MKLTGWAISLWIATSITTMLVALVVVVRHRFREFPFFSFWVVLSSLNTCVIYFVLYHLPRAAYLSYYYDSSLVDQCMQLLVAYEIATHVFAPTGKWAPDIRRTVITAGALCAVIALLLALSAQPEANRYATLVLRTNLFDSVLMSELFVCMVVLSYTAGLPWKTHTARIAQGLGAYSLVCVALGIGKIFFGLEHGTRTYDWLIQVRGLTAIACSAFWIVTLWINAPVAVDLPESLKIQIYTLNRRVENDLIRIRSWSKN